MTYQILSPDGFSINVDGGFKTKKAAMDFYEEWKRGYSTQGYYSSVNYGRIPLEDLDDYCQFVKHGREKVC